MRYAFSHPSGVQRRAPAVGGPPRDGAPSGRGGSPGENGPSRDGEKGSPDGGGPPGEGKGASPLPPGGSAHASARPDEAPVDEASLGRDRALRRRCAIATGVAGLAVLAGLAVVGIAIGAKPLTIGEVWSGLTATGRDRQEIPEAVIVWQTRMPRTALTVVVGASLALAGVAMQALTRNPLAEPGLLGVNSGAAFAVALAISAFGATSVDDYVWFAFAGSALAASFIYVVSARRGRTSGDAHLVLVGAAVSAALGSCTGIITMFDKEAFDSYRFWVIGSLADRGYGILAPLLPFFAAGCLLALLAGPSLNAMMLGEEQAQALGVRLGLVRAVVLLAVTLLCGAATAASGPIGFVGLAIPHILRLLVGVDQRTILGLALIAGPCFMLAADVIGRVAVSGELEVGIVTAFLGAPVLIAILVGKAAT